MSIYNVGVQEVNVVIMQVHLSEEHEKLKPEAKAAKIRELANMKMGEGQEPEEVEYSHTLDSEYWSIEKVG